MEPTSLPRPRRLHGRHVGYYTGGGKCASCQALAVELGWLDTVHSGPEPDGLRGDDAPERCRADGRQDARRDGWDHVKPDGAVLFSRKSYRECTQRQKAAVWLCEGCHTHQRTTSMLARRAGLCWLGERWGKMLCRPK